VPGRAHSLEGAGPLWARQGEPLVDGKSVHCEVESEGSRYEKVVAQLTESVYEAVASDKAAKICKVPI